MIVKCLRKFSSGDQWLLFEGGDKITYEEHLPDFPLAVCDDFEDLTIPVRSNTITDNTGDIPVKLISMFKKGEGIKQILANSPIYILNDEGKTIERI